MGCTAGLIAWIVVESQWIVARTGRTLAAFPLTICQIALFLLLFFQIAAHWGAAHYSWTRSPTVTDWIAFAGTHVFRAADLFDTIEAYGWHAQPIQHATVLTGACLVIFHVLVDFFVIGLLAEWFLRAKRWFVGFSSANHALVWAGRAVVAGWLFAWLDISIAVRPWRLIDFPLWLLDNFLRVLDFPDLMQIIGIRLHSVPQLAWEGTLSFTLRIMLLFWMARFVGGMLRALRMKLFGIDGLPIEDLRELTGHVDPIVAAEANRRLRYLMASGRSPGLLDNVDRRQLARKIVAPLLACLVVAWLLPDWTPTGKRLGSHVLKHAKDSPSRVSPTLASLTRMGSYAESAVPDLVEAETFFLANDRDWQRPRDQLFVCLGEIGPKGFEALADMALDSHGGARRDQILKAIRDGGPVAATALCSLLRSEDESLRMAADRMLSKLGPEAVEGLIAALTEQNVGYVIEHIQRLDPYWDRQPSDNPIFMEFAGTRKLTEEYRERLTADPQEGYEILESLAAKVREGNVWALPIVVDGLLNDDLAVRTAAARYFNSERKIEQTQPKLTRWLLSSDETRIDKAIRAYGMLDDIDAGPVYYFLKSYVNVSSTLQDIEGLNSQADVRRVTRLKVRLGQLATLLKNFHDSRNRLEQINEQEKLLLNGACVEWLVSAMEFAANRPTHRMWIGSLLTRCDPSWWETTQGRDAISRLNVDFERDPISLAGLYEQLGHSPEFILPALRSALRSKRSDARSRHSQRILLDVITKLGPAVSVLVPDLFPLLEDDSLTTRRSVLKSLDAIDPEWRSDLSAIIFFGEMQDLVAQFSPLPARKVQVIRLLSEVEARPTDAYKVALVRCLLNQDRALRSRAAMALHDLGLVPGRVDPWWQGDAAQELRPLIQTATQSSVSAVKDQAQRILKSLDG